MPTSRKINLAFCALAGLYLAMLLSAGGGRLALPWDDAYIYLRYAAQGAQGHFFQYNAGDAVSTGATGLLWLGWLTLGALVGLKSQALVWFAFLSCALLAFAALRAFLDLARTWGVAEPPAAALFILCGPLMAGLFSGMETALFAALLLGALARLARKDGGVAALPWLALLAFCRPEGQIAAVILGLWGWRAASADRDRALWLTLFPLALLPTLFTWSLTGPGLPDSLAPKSPLADPYADPWALAAQAVQYMLDVSKGLWMGCYGGAETVGIMGTAAAGNSAAGHFAPLTLALALWGLATLLGRDEAGRPGLGWGIGLWMAAGLVALSLGLPAGWNRQRYLLPLVPGLLVLLLAAAAELRRLAGGRMDSPARALQAAFWVLLLGFGALTSAHFLLETRRSAVNYASQHGRMARLLAQRVKPGERVAAFDVGVLAFESGHPVQDLAGVTDHRLAAAARQGAGAIFETMAAWPPERRPKLAALHEGRPDFPAEGLAALGLLEPVYYLDRGEGGRMGLYRLDLEGFAKAALPWRIPGRGHVADTLNVGLPADERRHGWTGPALGPVSPLALAGRFPVLGAEGLGPASDGGRLVPSHESFTLRGGQGKRLALAGRLMFDQAGTFFVYVAGREAGRLEVRPAPGKFQELLVPLPADLPAGAEVPVTCFLMTARDGSVPHASYHWWLWQE